MQPGCMIVTDQAFGFQRAAQRDGKRAQQRRERLGLVGVGGFQQQIGIAKFRGPDGRHQGSQPILRRQGVEFGEYVDQLPGKDQVAKPQLVALSNPPLGLRKKLNIARALLGSDISVNVQPAGLLEDIRRAFLLESGATIQ